MKGFLKRLSWLFFGVGEEPPESLRKKTPSTQRKSSPKRSRTSNNSRTPASGKRTSARTVHKTRSEGERKSPRKPASKTVPQKKKTPVKKKEPAKKVLGEVTHYFPKVHAAVIKIKAARVSVGDSIVFQCKTMSFKQTIKSMQINRDSVKSAGRGKEVGIRVQKPVSVGDRVFFA